MKTSHSNKSKSRSPFNEAVTFAGFSHRLARPSLNRTVSSLNDSLRIDDLWDFSLVQRLHAPVTRRHY